MYLLNLDPDRVAALVAAPQVQSLVARADTLRAEVHALHPLSAEATDRVMQKFRLDWDWHSNVIEGNKLTYGETKALLSEGVVAQGKSMKDHEDIKNHRNALNMVVEMVRNNEELRQHDVRSLHQLLLGQPFQTSARTPDGLPTRKWIYPGQYKDQPNHVETKSGEKHYYASVEETPALMSELTDWLTANRTAHHPLVLSALFHHAFVSIHPFDDGNGRMTRLLSNLVLMQAGFPPVIVRQQEREAYYAALSQADAGEPLRFVELIGEGLDRSLEIQLQGAKGDFSFEQDDLDKEIALFVRDLSGSVQEVNKLTNITLGQTLKEAFIPLTGEIIDKCREFDSFFLSNQIDVAAVGSRNINISANIRNSNDLSLEIEQWLLSTSSHSSILAPEQDAMRFAHSALQVTYTWSNFKSPGNNFHVQNSFRIDFNVIHYELSVERTDIKIVKQYGTKLDKNEISTLTTAFVRLCMEQIKQRVSKS